jgi:hypothetical protein
LAINGKVTGTCPVVSVFRHREIRDYECRDPVTVSVKLPVKGVEDPPLGTGIELETINGESTRRALNPSADNVNLRHAFRVDKMDLR